MPTDLALFVASAPLADTHEHLRREAEWIARPADVLVDLFDHYVPQDLVSAGAPPDAVEALLDPTRDVRDRWRAVESWWPLIRFTGYGEAVSSIAQRFYELEELTADALAAAGDRTAPLHQPGQRLHLLRDVAGLDHVQIDDFTAVCTPDECDPSFFHYDLSWIEFSTGEFALASLGERTGVNVSNAATLREALSVLFARHAPQAIAVKSQHAYTRSLAWSARSDADVEPLLARKLRGEELSRAELDVLGDWCLGRGAELAAQHGLPFKIHTGHMAGNNGMRSERIRPSLLCELLAAYPTTQFVLMHAGWPYGEELVSLAKHFTNVFSDCCWAWSMNPAYVARFVREHLHGAPLNKLLCFGGDTSWPIAAVAYAEQMRRWLARALAAEVSEGLLREGEAIEVAAALTLGNARRVWGGKLGAR